VISIGSSAFEDCSSLTSVTIGNNVTSIGNNAFDDCGSLKYNEYDNALYLGNKSNPYLVLVMAKTKGITSCEIHTNTKIISPSAFSGCRQLTSVIIPDGVMIIEDEAFSNCSNLTSVTIGTGVKSIGSQAFTDCKSMTSVYITDIVAWCAIDFHNDLYMYSSSNPLVYAKNLYLNGELVTDLVIPEGVTHISDFAFFYSAIKSVVILDSVTSIGENAFYGCSSLTSITIPDSVTSIGEGAFYKCSSLTSITFEGTVAEWNAITKGSNWNYNVPATEVVCSDGTVTLS
jgi:hypothetical protein